MRKPRGEAVLKNLPDALQEELWQYARRTTGAKACAWLLRDHGIKVSETTLSLFFSWYPRSLTLRMAAASSSQLEATLKKLPELNISAAQARSVAQVNFELQAAQDRDPKLFSALRKAERENLKIALERERFEHDKKADWEKGLDALHDEIKGNAEALKYFELMKSALKKGSA